MKRWRNKKMDMRIPRELVAALAAVLTLLWIGRPVEPPPQENPQPPSEEIWTMPVPTQAVGPASRGAAEREPVAVMVSVYDDEAKKVLTMELETYIAGVVAAEMPASYEEEALKAQAVAARTYAFRRLRAYGGSGCAKDAEADICTSYAHCQAYAGREFLLERWGGEYDMYWEKILGAVNGTRGELVTHQGQAIHAFFHAVSGGRTEDALAVFNMNLPYLTSVVSEGEEGAARYRSETAISRANVAKALNDAYPQARLAADRLPGQIEIRSRLQSGQVEKVRIGNVTITGSQFRRALGIDSANFTIGYDEKNAVFYTQGYGHGVGMSQAGANAMAKEGYGYREILAHYYSGTEIMSVEQVGK